MVVISFIIPVALNTVVDQWDDVSDIDHLSGDADSEADNGVVREPELDRRSPRSSILGDLAQKFDAMVSFHLVLSFIFLLNFYKA